jgi:hypothetical protein
MSPAKTRKENRVIPELRDRVIPELRGHTGKWPMAGQIVRE